MQERLLIYGRVSRISLLCHLLQRGVRGEAKEEASYRSQGLCTSWLYGHEITKSTDHSREGLAGNACQLREFELAKDGEGSFSLSS